MVEGINSTAKRDLISTNDTSIDSQETAGEPPANGVSEEVDLLAGRVLSPEADATEQERPLVGVASIRMAASQLVVVVEHSSLELEPLLEEGKVLDLALRLLASSIISGQGSDVLNKPDIGAGSNLLVAVDLLLLVGPLRKRLGVSPHGHFAGIVDELEMAGNGLEVLVLLSMLNANLEESIVCTASIGILERDASKLLVGGVVWGGNIVRKKDLVSHQVSKANKIVVLDITSSLLVVVDREDLPVVVGIVVGVSSNLLALAGNTTIIISKRVAILVAVKIGLGLLMPDSDAVVILNVKRIGQHNVVAKGLLEFWGHEIIARTRSGENGEVDLEPEKVEKEWHNGQAEGTSSKMLGEFLQRDGTTGALDVEKIPKINGDSGSNGNEGEEADVLDRDVARERKAGQDEPLPPLPGEGLVSKLVELDVEQQTASHGKNQSRIEKNESGLANVGVVKQNQASSNDTSWQTVARLPHDQVGDRHGQGAENGGHSSKSDIGDLVGDVGIANVLEVEVTVISNKPAHKREQELAERRMDIEEVGSLEIVGSELKESTAISIQIKNRKRINIPCRSEPHRTRPHWDG